MLSRISNARRVLGIGSTSHWHQELEHAADRLDSRAAAADAILVANRPADADDDATDSAAADDKDDRLRCRRRQRCQLGPPPTMMPRSRWHHR